MGISIKNAQEIKAMRESGKILAEALSAVVAAAKPGISTYELDQIAEKTILKHGGIPGFKGYHGFPATICSAVNDIIVHGIPSKEQILQEGDLFTVDCGVIVDRLNTDAARSIGIGEISNEKERLISTAKKALKKGIEAAQAGNFVGDISKAIEKVINQAGYKVIYDLTGHGIGYKLHEAPNIPNFFEGKGAQLKPGMTIAIEPIFSVGTHEMETLDDNWTIVTDDGSLAVQEENTILITQNGPEILTENR